MTREITPAEIRDLVGTSPFIIEIGCNDGTDTAKMLAAMPEARFYCFEPELRALSRFCLRDHPQVTLIALAVAHRSGALDFWPSTGVVPGSSAPCANDWDYSGGLSHPTGHLIRDKVVRFKEPIRVPTITLDSLVHQYPDVVDFIWQDVQGAEAKVILGGRETLRRTRYLYTEYYDTPQYDRQPNLEALISFLPDFDVVALYNGNVLFKNRTIA